MFEALLCRPPATSAATGAFSVFLAPGPHLVLIPLLRFPIPLLVYTSSEISLSDLTLMITQKCRPLFGPFLAVVADFSAVAPVDDVSHQRPVG